MVRPHRVRASPPSHGDRDRFVDHQPYFPCLRPRGGPFRNSCLIPSLGLTSQVSICSAMRPDAGSNTCLTPHGLHQIGAATPVSSSDCPSQPGTSMIANCMCCCPRERSVPRQHRLPRQPELKLYKHARLHNQRIFALNLKRQQVQVIVDNEGAQVF